MYLEIDEGYWGHRKTLRLCALLKNPEADTYPPRLWSWATRSAPDGELGGMDAYELECAVRYRPLDGKLFAALALAGFIDEMADGTKRIHNWQVRTGAAIARMTDRASQMRELRSHRSGGCVPETCRHCVRGRGDTVHSRVNHRDVTNPTRRDITNPTSPVQSSPDKTSSDPDPDHAHAVAGPDPEYAAPPTAVAPALAPVASQPAINTNGVPPPGKLRGYYLQQTFARLRSEVIGGLAWSIPPDTSGKATTFAERLTPEEIADIEPTMRLMFGHIKEGQDDWEDERLRKSASFAFGTWIARFSDLREELHDKRPAKRAKAEIKWFDPNNQPR